MSVARWFRTATLLVLALPAAAAVPSPEEHLGFRVGADRKLADYHQIVQYLEIVDAGSDRLRLLRLGKTTLGNDFVVAAISAPENLEGSERYRAIARRLADPRGLSAEEEAALIAEGKVIVLVTLSIHSTEIGASQMGMELAWKLAVAPDPDERAWMEDVILLVVPSLNPDGQIMVTEWYREHVGTEYEGGPMPRLYHHYAGHDNNRDWFMLNLAETRLLNRLLYHDWHPHIFVDEHQMGMSGPRLFLPPFKDPLGENVHPLIWRLIDRVGTPMALREQEAGHAGVIQSAQFDAYWLGGTRNTGFYKNVVGLLTEMASVRVATPVYVDPGELRGGLKGLPEYRSQANFPDPWPGGWWRLRDIIDYEMVLNRSLLETASTHRVDFLRDQARMARDAVARGEEADPAAWIVPAGGRDPVAAAAMVELLLEHGVEVRSAAAEVRSGRRIFPPGSWVVPAAQPYRQFAREVLEPQRYPEIRVAPDGPILLPYDVNNWSLPALFGVETEILPGPLPGGLEPVQAAPYPGGGVEGDGPAFLLSPVGNAPTVAVNRLLADGVDVRLARAAFQAAGSRWPAGTAIVAGAPRSRLAGIGAELHVTFVGAATVPPVAASRLRKPRVGLYQGFVPSMDEGWTRLVLDRHAFPYVSLDNAAIRAGSLRESFDVIVLADQSRKEIVEGRVAREERGYYEEYPEAYRGGIGKEGVEALEAFVREGGTLVTLDGSSELPVESFNIPVSRPLAKARSDDFYCPGSMLRVEIDSDHPLGYGMPRDAAVLFARSQPFRTLIPGAEVTRKVVARFPDRPLLVSGWLRGEERLRRLAALVEIRLGAGRVVLFGFRPQFRGQTRATFKLLFNAIHSSAVEDADPEG